MPRFDEPTMFRLLRQGIMVTGNVEPLKFDRCENSALGHVFKSLPDSQGVKCVCGHLSRISVCVRCGVATHRSRDREELQKQHQKD